MESYQKMEKLDIPVIFFDKVPDTNNINKVCVADEEAAKIAAANILAKGKKKVLAVMGNSGLLMTKKRLAAFTRTLDNKAELLVRYASSSEEAETITLATLPEKPDTIFCMSDEVLTGAMKAIQISGLRIPADIAVIAISNGFIPKLYYPEISYVETSGYKLGKLAFNRMMECLSDSNTVKELNTESIFHEGGSM